MHLGGHQLVRLPDALLAVRLLRMLTMVPWLLANQDEFGDPERIEVMAAAGQEMTKGDKIANIHWEGFMRTASDELYHAVWVRDP